MRVLVSDPIVEEGLEVLRASGAEVDYHPGLPRAKLLERLPHYDALMVRSQTQVDAEVIQVGSRLKVIGRAGVGVDNIDVATATERGIVVVNSPEGNTIAAAELTFEAERALEVALQLYRKGTADFADCLHIALAAEAGEQPLWTFDKSAAKVIGAQLLRTR